jgi:hypothetical protein
MSDDKVHGSGGKLPGKFLGSLREALAAAGRDDSMRPAPAATAEPAASANAAAADKPVPTRRDGATPSAAEAARDARGGTPNIPPMDRHVEFETAPTTRVVRAGDAAVGGAINSADTSRTQILRGKQVVKRGQFHQDPVVGWLVIVGGPGLGAYRPVFEGNNTVGRSPTQRIPIDFGDDAISSEEQAYLRYDSNDRTFLFVPNLAKTNVVSVNSKKPTSAVALAAMDVIVMGRTQLVFVPFCGPDFDWSDLPDIKD